MLVSGQATYRSDDWFSTCLSCIGVLISGTFSSIYRSKDRISIGCRTGPAMAVGLEDPESFGTPFLQTLLLKLARTFRVIGRPSLQLHRWSASRRRPELSRWIVSCCRSLESSNRGDGFLGLAPHQDKRHLRSSRFVFGFAAGLVLLPPTRLNRVIRLRNDLIRTNSRCISR